MIFSALFKIDYIDNMNHFLTQFEDGLNYEFNSKGIPCFKTSKQTWSEVVLDGLSLDDYYKDQTSSPRPVESFGIIDRYRRNGRPKWEWNNEPRPAERERPRRSRNADLEKEIEEELIYDYDYDHVVHDECDEWSARGWGRMYDDLCSMDIIERTVTWETLYDFFDKFPEAI